MDFILKVPHFVEPDSEMYIEEVNMLPGGSALNFAVNASLAGMDSGIIAKIGNDSNGEIIYRELSEKGVETSQIKRIDYSTGMAFISVDRTGKRSIYSFIGANEFLKLSIDDFEYIQSSQMTHISGTYWEVAYDAAKYANTLSFAPGALLSSFGMKKLDPVLSNTDILFLNEKEVEILTQLSYNNGIDSLLEKGIPLLVITLGDKGSILYTKTEKIKFSAVEGPVIDTTGAGDAFAAGFIVNWIKNQSLDTCLKEASISAANCIKKMGGI